MQTPRRFIAVARGTIGLFALAASAILLACSETSSPTAAVTSRPDPTGQTALDRGGVPAHNSDASSTQGLLRDVALGRPVTVSRKIGHSGGIITVPGTDFQLIVPRGAIPGDTLTISVTALAGSAIAYEFQPHGTVFNVPLTFAQGLNHTRLHGSSAAPGQGTVLQGAYFQDASLVDPSTGTAQFSELIPADISATWTGNVVTFPIHHFSGYMVSTGRR